jgi:hypothetical protein
MIWRKNALRQNTHFRLASTQRTRSTGSMATVLSASLKPCLDPHPQSYEPEEITVNQGVPWSSSGSTEALSEESTEHTFTCSTQLPELRKVAAVTSIYRIQANRLTRLTLCVPLLCGTAIDGSDCWSNVVQGGETWKYSHGIDKVGAGRYTCNQSLHLVQNQQNQKQERWQGAPG